LRYISGSVHN